MIGETKRNAGGKFTPSSIDKTLKEYGDARLQAIYTPEEYQAASEKLASELAERNRKITEQTQALLASEQLARESATRDIITLAATGLGTTNRSTTTLMS